MSDNEHENGVRNGVDNEVENDVDNGVELNEALEKTPANWVDYAEDRKIYVSSLNFATRNDSLKAYFEKFGEVEKAEVKMESANRSRGFGFVIFDEPEVLDSLLEQKHTLDGREVEVKRAITMKEKFSTNKLFVGGLPPKLANDDVVEFFNRFGEVQDIEWVVDRVTGNRKGFCFVIFVESEPVELVTDGKVPPQSQKHEIKGYTVECKKKFPDNHPVQKKIKRIQQQKKERALAQEYNGQEYIAYGYDYYANGYYDTQQQQPQQPPQQQQQFGYGYPAAYGYGYPTYGGAVQNTKVAAYNPVQNYRHITPVSN